MRTPFPTARPATCVIHCRVSTKRAAHEGESLEVQEAICTNIAAARGWKLSHQPWREGSSGRKDNRPVFKSILAHLDANPGTVSYYLFRSIDRFTRRGSFSYEEMKRELTSRGVQLIDSYGIIQPVRNTLEDVGFEYDWSMVSPSAISELVIAAASNAEVTSILTRTISQEIRLTQRGYKMRGANDGYRNVKVAIEGKKYTIQEADPERAPYWKAIYEMRATGAFTDAEICARVNAMGYRSRIRNRWDATQEEVVGKMGGKPLTIKGLQAAIAHPIYCGVICEKWTCGKPVKTAYPGLVSIDTFNAANRGKVYISQGDNGGLDIHYDYNPRLKPIMRSRHNPLFPFKGVVVCHLCARPLLGSSPRGKGGKYFPAYHCARTHPYWSVPKKVLDAELERLIDGLSFNPQAVPTIRAHIEKRYDARKGEIRTADARILQSVAELEIRKAAAVNSFKLATSDVMRRSLEADAVDLDKQIANAGAVHPTVRIAESDIKGYFKFVEKIIEHPSKMLKARANHEQLRACFSLVFRALPTREEIANRTPKLRWIFRLSSRLEEANSLKVSLQGFEWNTFEEEVLEWKRVSPYLWYLDSDIDDDASVAA